MKKLVLVSLVTILIIVFYIFDLGQYFNLEFLKTQKQAFDHYNLNNPLLTMMLFFIAYILMAALSLPGGAIMTLAGGAIFGLIKGTILISFASTIGATLAFLISRTLLRDVIQSRFGDSLMAVNEGIKKDGAFYLFTIRLVPIFPFFVVNLVMGLTPLKTSVFYWVSQIGMLAGTIVYVNAGTQLGKLESVSGILSPALIGSFVLLGVFPLIAKKGLEFYKQKKKYEGI